MKALQAVNELWYLDASYLQIGSGDDQNNIFQRVVDIPANGLLRGSRRVQLESNGQISIITIGKHGKPCKFAHNAFLAVSCVGYDLKANRAVEC